MRETDNINPYLISGPNVMVQSASKPLADLDEMSFGNMPNEGGYLLLDATEAANAIERHGVPSKFIRPFIGSQEFIRGSDRRCIWITDEEVEEASANNWLSERFEAVRKQRVASNRATTKELAAVPYRFGEVRQTGCERTIVVPRVSSENRDHLPVGLAPVGTVIGDRNFALYDAPLYNLALIASRLHWVWIGTVCVRLRTDFSYSNTLGWNAFPVPPLTEKMKADLTRCAEDILLAREAHFPSTIADLYDPEEMPDDLREAHERNDEVLERIYIGRRFKNDTERLEKLFALYTEMTAKEGTTENRKVGAR
ncbi:type IIL restriction-modification enzyme MmeI [Hoeflea sp.]|uniref:type IIL restriction-modification enzyme MmeI n=1 Tax=Hoeflea sp. TaxID=1940281 RepID=UPI003B02CF0C